MYYGYRYLFQYKNYYFQLVMESCCITDNCKYCNEENEDENSSHFKLDPFAFIDPISNKLKPYNDVILVNNMMPEIQWNTD